LSAALQYCAPIPGILWNEYVFYRSINQQLTLRSRIMVRRIFSLTFLLASLFFAGLPAFAYSECVSTQDCCPNGPLAPCNMEGSVAAPSNGVQPCCAVSPAAPAAFAAGESSNKFHKHLKRFDIPVILVSPAISLMAYVALSRSAAISATASFSPSYALLYLSTGRLRL
jgi:hypothetical protein